MSRCLPTPRRRHRAPWIARALRDAVQRLEELLAQDALEAIDVFEAAAPMLKTAFGERADQIGQLVKDYRFEDALVALRASASGPEERPSAGMASPREPDPSHQIREPRVRAQRIEPRLDAKVLQLGVPLSIGVFERRERLLPLAQRRQQERQFGCGAALLARSQALKDRLRARAVARPRGRGAKIDLRGRGVETERNGSRVRRNSLRVLALSGIRVSEKQMRIGIASGPARWSCSGRRSPDRIDGQTTARTRRSR